MQGTAGLPSASEPWNFGRFTVASGPQATLPGTPVQYSTCELLIQRILIGSVSLRSRQSSHHALEVFQHPISASTSSGTILPVAKRLWKPTDNAVEPSARQHVRAMHWNIYQQSTWALIYRRPTYLCIRCSYQCPHSSLDKTLLGCHPTFPPVLADGSTNEQVFPRIDTTPTSSAKPQHAFQRLSPFPWDRAKYHHRSLRLAISEAVRIDVLTLAPIVPWLPGRRAIPKERAIHPGTAGLEAPTHGIGLHPTTSSMDVERLPICANPPNSMPTWISHSRHTVLASAEQSFGGFASSIPWPSHDFMIQK